MKKLGEMTEKECLDEMATNEEKRLAVVAQIKPLESKCTKFYNRNQRLQDRIAQIKKSKDPLK